MALTVAPASEAAWANFLLMEPPALNRAMSTPEKLRQGRHPPSVVYSTKPLAAFYHKGKVPRLLSVSSSMVCVAPSHSTVLPADLHPSLLAA